jgi:hypothetical protein
MAITGVPDYKGEPLAVFIRCPRCFARLLVWTAKDDPVSVEPLGNYVYIDSRTQSSVNCTCGELLPLAEVLLAEGVM